MTMPFERPSIQDSAEASSKLRERLFSGDLSPDDFLEALMEIDQSTPSHDAAHATAVVLESPEVRARCVTGKEDIFGYANLLSLSRFHAGQSEAMAGGDALPEFEKSLAAALEVEDPGYSEWQDYVRATVAYFRKDQLTLERSLDVMPDGANRRIIANLLQGLKARGDIDYRADYRT